MKLSEIKKGDLIGLANEDQYDWTIDDYESKVRIEDLELCRKFVVGDSGDGWTSHQSSVSRVSFSSKKLKKNRIIKTQEAPAVEFRFKVATVVLPYQRTWMKGMFKSNAVYLGCKNDPFAWEGVNRHHRILLNGQICFVASYMFRFLRKIE